MVGSDRVRYCSECNLNVYNFSAMTVEEVQRLLATHEGRLCGRLYRRQDGTIIRRDCPVGSRIVIRRISQVAGVALSAAMGLSQASAQTLQEKPSSPLVQIESDKAAVVVIVTDASGALMPNARVSLMDVSRSLKAGGVTDSFGKLQLSNLTVGSYSLSVESPGFEIAHQIIAVSGSETVEVQLTLSPMANLGVVVEAVVDFPIPDVRDVPDLLPQEGTNDSASPISNPASSKKNLFRRMVAPCRRIF